MNLTAASFDAIMVALGVSVLTLMVVFMVAVAVYCILCFLYDMLTKEAQD